MMHKVLVYGTLMRGQSNHNCFLSGSEFVGNGEIVGYALYKVSSYPGIIHEAGERVKGELYNVDDNTLCKLDCLEGEGSLYLREMVDVQTGAEVVNAFTYIWNGSVDVKNKVDYGKQPWNGGYRSYE